MLALYIVVGCYILGVILANIANINAKSKGMDGIPLKNTFDPRKWFSVIYGMILEFILPYHVFLQVAERVFHPNCQTCLKNGVCNGGSNKIEGEEGCGCHTYAKMLSPFEKDFSENWGKVERNKEKFKQRLKDYPVIITAKITENELL